MRRRALALPVVMSLIVIMILIAVSVASSGVATLNMAGSHNLSLQSVYAAEAGIAASFRQIIQGTAGWTGFSNVPYGKESVYSVVATAGPAPAGPDRPAIPAGTVYLLATATTRKHFPRKVGVLVTGTGLQSAGFNFVVATGGGIDAQGNNDYVGSLKAGRSITEHGNIKVIPYQGSGRQLAGQDIDQHGNIRRDPSQEMRAGGVINGSSAVDPVRLIFPADSTPASAPFIADPNRYSSAVLPGDGGRLTLPNPDPAQLLGLTPDGAGNYTLDALGNYTINATVAPDVVLHDDSPATLNLNNQVHFFPHGIAFSGNNAVSGNGTIVVGEGNTLSIQGNHNNLKVNLIALRWPVQWASLAGNPSIDLKGNINMSGLVYAHEDVSIRNNVDLEGMVIAFHDGAGDFSGHGNQNYTYNANGLTLRGFTSWLNPPTAPVGPGTLGLAPGQPLRILSWERL